MLDLDWTSSDCTSVRCPARLPSHRSAITTALFPGAGGPVPVYSILSLLKSSFCILLPYTTLHYCCPCLLFPDPTIVHYRSPSPRLDTSLLLLSPSFFTPGSGTHWPPSNPTCPLCLSSDLRRPQSHPSSLLESGTQPHLYINFLSFSDETAIHAISQSGRHRRSKPSPGTLCCLV
jgi:hypothetical protein